jgi:hypothetical protein
VATWRLWHWVRAVIIGALKAVFEGKNNCIAVQYIFPYFCNISVKNRVINAVFSKKSNVSDCKLSLAPQYLCFLAASVSAKTKAIKIGYFA